MNRVLCEGIYSYFVSTYGTKSTKVRETKERPLHNRALKEVERKKKEAKRELRSARRSGFPEMVHSSAHHFFTLVRAHSQLKRASNAHLMKRDVKAAREKCHRDFKGCARDVLDGGLGQEVPMFSEDDVTTFFKQAYCSAPRNYAQPEWMPVPLSPEVEMDCSPFSPGEIARVIKKMKAWSAPSPFDRVGYVIFKKCPSLIPALVKLFNICWNQSIIPGSGGVQQSSSFPRAQQLKMPPIQPTFDQLH